MEIILWTAASIVWLVCGVRSATICHERYNWDSLDYHPGLVFPVLFGVISLITICAYEASLSNEKKRSRREELEKAEHEQKLRILKNDLGV